MIFHKIDTQTWNRSDSYLHYLHAVPCTYSMTLNLDITAFLVQTKTKEYKFFPALLYAISHTVNKHKEFRMDLDAENNVGYYEISNPCFTLKRKQLQISGRSILLILINLWKITRRIWKSIRGILKIQNRLPIKTYLMSLAYLGRVLQDST